MKNEGYGYCSRKKREKKPVALMATGLLYVDGYVDFYPIGLKKLYARPFFVPHERSKGGSMQLGTMESFLPD